MPKTLSIGLCLASILTLALVPAAGAASGSKGFPPAGIDVIDHELTIAIHQVASDGGDGEQLEVLTFNGQMTVERQDPYVNSDGFRQIDFFVTTWEAVAFSQVLDTLVVYRLSNQPQIPSRIVAQQRSSDYPAEFVFKVIFDALAYGEIFVPGHHGMPFEKGFFEVPPSGNRRTSPTITGFETERIEMDHPALGRIRFVPRDCNDSSGKTIHTFPAPEEKPAAAAG